MPSLSPDFRYKEVRRAVKDQTPPRNDRELTLYEVLNGRTGADYSVTYAYEIFCAEYQREVLQAWLATNAADNIIEANTRVPQPVIAAFRWLFLDLSVFRDDLALFDWARSYKGSDFGKGILQQAVMNGPTALQWLFNRGDVRIDPKVAMQQVMTDAYFRSRMGRGAGINSPEAKAAHQYMQTALKSAEVLAKNDTGNMIADLIIKLEHRDLTLPVEEEIAVKLLH